MNTHDEEEESQSPDDNFLNEVIAVLDECYEPVDDLKDLDTFITTDDIYNALQDIFPSEGLFGHGVSTIASLMKQAGFKFTMLKSAHPQFVWLIKRR